MSISVIPNLDPTQNKAGANILKTVLFKGDEGSRKTLEEIVNGQRGCAISPEDNNDVLLWLLSIKQGDLPIKDTKLLTGLAESMLLKADGSFARGEGSKVSLFEKFMHRLPLASKSIGEEKPIVDLSQISFDKLRKIVANLARGVSKQLKEQLFVPLIILKQNDLLKIMLEDLKLGPNFFVDIKDPKLKTRVSDYCLKHYGEATHKLLPLDIAEAFGNKVAAELIEKNNGWKYSALLLPV